MPKYDEDVAMTVASAKEAAKTYDYKEHPSSYPYTKTVIVLDEQNQALTTAAQRALYLIVHSDWTGKDAREALIALNDVLLTVGHPNV